jgi:hypothetical protein
VENHEPTLALGGKFYMGRAIIFRVEAKMRIAQVDVCNNYCTDFPFVTLIERKNWNIPSPQKAQISART